MADIVTRLQEAVGDTYRIEQEMARGGMSRLFLATEASLNRKVVVKLLPPDFASEVSATRFRKEAELAAGLQHPHILPILGAGSRGDLLYYVMPYVEGESLRHHLDRHGKMPVDVVVRLLSEVAGALAYAHSRGIVHRDIKPENILLEQGHAVLTDFGVARALAESTTARLTETGMSVGTPAYMSPEQLAAEPNIDARADVYALAVVGYEMLTGGRPFTGATAQAVLVAAVNETPKPVAAVRPEVPARVSAAIATGMAKDPDQRYPSAGAFRDALGAPAEGGRPARARLIAGAAAVLVVAALALFALRRGSSADLDPNLLAVAPFGVVGAEDLDLWGEGLLDVVSRHLDGAGDLRTLSPTVAIQRWEGRADPASARAFGERTGAGLVVFGSIVGLGPDSARLVATLYDVVRGRAIGRDIELRETRERADRFADALALRVVQQLSTARPVGAARLTSIGSSSPAAVKAFLQGEQFLRRISWDSAIAYFETATREDSTFALAYWRLGDALAWNAQSGRAARERAAALNRGGLTVRDSLLITFDSIFAVIGSTVGQTRADLHQRLWATVETAIARFPEDPFAWYKYGDALLHSGSIGGRWPDSAQVAFGRAIALDSAQPDALEHAKLLAWHLDGPDRAREYVGLLLALDPEGAKGESVRLEAALLDSALTPEEFAARARTLSRGAMNDLMVDLTRAVAYDSHTVMALRIMAERFAPARGRVAMALAYRGRPEEAGRLAPQGYAASAVRVTGMPLERLQAEADSVFALEAMWQEGTFAPYAITLALSGDVQRIERVISQLERYSPVPPERRQENQQFRTYIRAVTRRDTAAIRSARGRLPQGSVEWQFQLAEAMAWAEAGAPREGLARIEPLGMSVATPYHTDPLQMRLILERARLHDQVGNRTQALRDYNYVRGIWANADEALQPVVREAEEAIRRLTAESPPS